MTYFTTIISHIISTFKQEEWDINSIKDEFDLMVLKYGKKLYERNVKHPYQKAHNQLLKYIQIKLNKTNLKINIYDYIPECKSIYVLQMI